MSNESPQQKKACLEDCLESSKDNLHLVESIPTLTTKAEEKLEIKTDVDVCSGGANSKMENVAKEAVNFRKRKYSDSVKDCDELLKVENLEQEVEMPGDTSSVVVEIDVGITEFISKHEGFSGTIKQRYSDFIVNEINMDGEIVRLTDTSCPSFEKNNKLEEASASEVLTDDQVTQLRQLQETKSEESEFLIKVGDDKELRTKIHQAIKSFSNLDSITADRDGIKFIVVKYQKKKEIRKASIWTKTNGDYCKFILYKENKDTLEAINLITKYLRTKTGLFTFAGTKDRRAKTIQEVTAYRVEPERLQNINKCLRNIVLGNFRLCKQPLKLGDLQGNHFVIILRNVTGSVEQIEQAMTSLREVGFVNYYGMQRFGTTHIPTHHVGRALLRSQWTEAIDLILKPREGDKDEMAKARDVWQKTKDPKKCLVELKGYHCMESKLLEGLARYSKSDYVSALSMIPRNMRLMYIHAYQSYIWNSVVSRRIREFGLIPRVGDLAFRGQPSEDNETDRMKSNDKQNEPVLVTEKNISEFSIADVVLPLPGHDIRYPENEIKQWYQDLLKIDGMHDFNFKHKVRDYSLPGNYRKVVVRPDHVTWEVMYYDDYQQSLIQGDLEVMNSETLSCSLKEGRFKAMKMELSLPSSSYATMAIREVLKCGTSSAYHTTLNVT